jgi:hypothetical protein
MASARPSTDVGVPHLSDGTFMRSPRQPFAIKPVMKVLPARAVAVHAADAGDDVILDGGADDRLGGELVLAPRWTGQRAAEEIVGREGDEARADPCRDLGDVVNAEDGIARNRVVRHSPFIVCEAGGRPT